MSALTHDVREYRMLIGGESLDAETGQRFESVNPYTGAVGATAPEAGEAAVDWAVRAARQGLDDGPLGGA